MQQHIAIDHGHKIELPSLVCFERGGAAEFSIATGSPAPTWDGKLFYFIAIAPANYLFIHSCVASHHKFNFYAYRTIRV